MGKHLPSGRCVYCLKHFETLTWDHVFPKSWYPNNTPTNLEKWKVPSCKKCNNEYGKIEEDLLFRLGLCVDPAEAKSSGITDKILRSIDPEYATSEKEEEIRKRKREKILKEIIKSENIPQKGILPNFGPRNDIEHPRYLEVLISKNKLKSFGVKLVRGITYIIDRSFIEEDYEIEIFFVEDINTKHIIDLIKKFGNIYYRGPGVIIGRAVPHDDKKSALFAVEIWGKLKMYAAVERQ